MSNEVTIPKAKTFKAGNAGHTSGKQRTADLGYRYGSRGNEGSTKEMPK